MVVAVLLIVVGAKLVHQNGDVRPKILKLVLFQAVFVDHNRLPRIHLKLLFLFFSFFLVFNFNFLRGTIKTEKCTVQTDEIVDSAAKLVDTPKMLVVSLAGSGRLRSAPERSFLNRLSRRKFEVLNTLNELEQMKARGLNQYVIFSAEIGLIYTASLFSQHANDVGSVAFVSPTGYYESLSVFLMRRSLGKEQKEFINSGWALDLER